MLDATHGFELPLEHDDHSDAHSPARSARFASGEHTAADDETRSIVSLLLTEVGVLSREDTQDFLHKKKRERDKVQKAVFFMSSLVRAALIADTFSIPMGRHYWVGKPCGYKAAREVTDALLVAGYIQKHSAPSKGRGLCTGFRCSAAFREHLEGWRAVLRFKRIRPDSIEVREPKVRCCGKVTGGKRIALSRLPPEEVLQQRETMSQILDGLSGHRLEDAQGKHLSTSLVRIFAGDFSNGGRLYGEYQNLPETQRLACTIDGEPVCEIDLKASHPSILAAIYRHSERPPQDPYSEIPWVEIPQHRKAAKTLVQCSIHSPDGRLKKFPRGDKGVSFRDKHKLGNMTVRDLMPGIFKVFPYLDGAPRLTLPLQYLEAEIIVDALLRLKRRNIPAFPIHDSFLVKRSDQEEVVRVLQEVLRDHLGVHAPWLDVSTTDTTPTLIAPLPCSKTQPYILQYVLEDLLKQDVRSHSVSLDCAEHTDIREEDDMLIDLEDM